MRVDFRPELGLSGSRFKTDEEAEPAVREELEPCTPFVDDSRGLLEELIRAIRGGAEAVTTGRDHLKTLGTVLACVESLETGRWVDLGELYRKLGIPASLLQRSRCLRRGSEPPDGRDPGLRDGAPYREQRRRGP